MDGCFQLNTGTGMHPLAALVTNVKFKLARAHCLRFLNSFCLAQDAPWTDLPPGFAAFPHMLQDVW